MNCLRKALVCGMLISVSLSALELSLVPGFKNQEWAERVEFHGFLSQAWMNTTKNNYMANDTVGGSFSWTEIGLNASMQITDDLRIGGQVFIKELGQFGNWDPIIDWLYIDYRFTDWFGLRLGKLKIPNGLLGEYRDLTFTFPWAILPPGYSYVSRQYSTSVWGAGIYGNILLGGLGDMDYTFYYGTKSIDRDDAISVRTGEELSAMLPGAVTTDSWDITAMYGGQLLWNTSLDGLTIAATTIMSNLSSDSDSVLGKVTLEVPDYCISKLSAKYQTEKLTLIIEYSREYSGNLTVAIPAIGMNNRIERIDKESYYSSLSYQLTDFLSIGTYYGVSESRENRDDGKFLRDFAVNLQYKITDYWDVKLEAHACEGESTLLNFNNPGGLERRWYLFVVKTSINF